MERKQACRYPRFPNINEQSLYIVEISIVTLIRTDTTLDLSQKAEKSILTTCSICVLLHSSKPTSRRCLRLVGCAVNEEDLGSDIT